MVRNFYSEWFFRKLKTMWCPCMESCVLVRGQVCCMYAQALVYIHVNTFELCTRTCARVMCVSMMTCDLL